MKTMKFRMLLGTVAALACMLFASCAKDVFDLTGSIKGVVKDANDGHFIENCLVSLTPGGVSQTTTQSGVFEFAGLTPGEYTLSFVKTGYPNTSKTVIVVTGEETNSDVLLKANSPFALSDETLNFGDLETDKSFYVANNTDAECSYTISNIPEWLTFNKTKGTIGATAQAAISAKIDRSKVDYGSFSHNVIINYSGRTTGQVFLSVKFDKVKLTTPEVTIASDGENITETSFDIKGNLVATGGSQVLNHGHCWSTSKNPTIGDNKTELGQRKETGSFMSSITGLTTYTTYYVRAYAENAQGISYSDEIVVTTQDAYSDKWDGNLASSFAGGKGTKVDPYMIETGGQLLLMKDYKSSYFKLANNINLNMHNWLPFEFLGELDGGGYTIYNLKIERNDEAIGIFSVLYGKVENLNVNGVAIKGKTVGSITGIMEENAIIQNCHIVLNSNSLISGEIYTGGIVGKLGSNAYYTDIKGDIKGCSLKSNSDEYLILGNDGVGGIVGAIDLDHYGEVDFNITDCNVSCNIMGASYIGGIVGNVNVRAYADYISNCEYDGNLSGIDGIGGIVGFYSGLTDGGTSANGSSLTISSCKAVVNIFAETGFSGGILGATGEYAGCNIVTSYSSGTLADEANDGFIGGIIGGCTDSWRNRVRIYMSYSAMTSSQSSFKGIGDCKSESECAYIENYTDITTFFKELYSEYASHWNFNNQWTWSGTINGQNKQVKCPRLAWE